MVAELPRTNPAGYRPPPGRPPRVTFSPDPDDRDRDMFVYLRDNVKMLLAHLANATSDQYQRYIDLINQRRNWVTEEMVIERMMEVVSAPPLGLESDPYDLGELADVQRDFRREKFVDLLRMLDQAQMNLEERFWEQLWPSNPSS